MRGHVSESNEHPDDLEHDEPATSEPTAAQGDDMSDDDMGDLEDLDVDDVVAELSAGTPRKRARPVWISAVVMLACLYPLVSMWGDFRFWLRSSEPEALGDAAAVFQPGQAVPDLADRYVSIEGTPDVQWATVLTKKSGAKVSYLRVLEGDGRLFAAVPRPEGKDNKTPEYPSSFTGRVTRFGDAPTHDWIARLYAQEGVHQLHDVEPAALAQAASAGEAQLRLTTTDGRAVEATAADLDEIAVGVDEHRLLHPGSVHLSERHGHAPALERGLDQLSILDDVAGRGGVVAVREDQRVPLHGELPCGRGVGGRQREHRDAFLRIALVDVGVGGFGDQGFARLRPGVGGDAHDIAMQVGATLAQRGVRKAQ
jgi:hypothetical protein